jgi:hypothetical protein
MGERRLHHQEMRQKQSLRDTFFGLKSEPQRPTSVATEFMDTDYDDDEIVSEIEDNSPRVSINSVSSAGVAHAAVAANTGNSRDNRVSQRCLLTMRCQRRGRAKVEFSTTQSRRSR